MLQFNNERVATHTNGEDIYLFKLTNSKNTQVGITNYGAIIQSFVIQNSEGKLQDIVLGFDDVARYMESDYYSKDYPYLGAVIGRYGNRIGHARFPLNGTTIQVSPNFDPHLLHGGHKYRQYKEPVC
jgi:aldose 1-epimerase